MASSSANGYESDDDAAFAALQAHNALQKEGMEAPSEDTTMGSVGPLAAATEGSFSTLSPSVVEGLVISTESSWSPDNQSMSTLEQERHRFLLPGARERAGKDEVDLNEAQDSKEREDFFRSVVPSTYRIVRTLGRGHNGVVFAARREDDGQDVAIKFLEQKRAGQEGRRLREIAAHGLLPPHPRIVRLLSRELHSAGTYDYFVMELCDTSLENWIRETALERRRQMQLLEPGSRLPPALAATDAIRLIYELCDALRTLRQFGVIHRDIKPSNILLCKAKGGEGETLSSTFPYHPKLADFGVADMQVTSVPANRRYDNAMVPIRGDFMIQDDFRSAVASVLFAWLGLDSWHDREVRSRLWTDDGLLHVVATQLKLNANDKQLREWFERAIPMPRKVAMQDIVTISEAPKTLVDLANRVNMTEKLPLIATDTGKKDDDVSYLVPALTSMTVEEAMDIKLERVAHYALSAIGGRRHAKDFEGAKRYLEWVEFVFSRFHRQVPDAQYSEYHFQVAATIFLPRVQQLVRDYTELVRNHEEEVSASRVSMARNEVEEALSALDLSCNTGKTFENRARAQVTSTSNAVPDSPPGANLFALIAVERVKYLQLCHEPNRALEEALGGVKDLTESLNQFADAAMSPNASEELGVTPERINYLRRKAFQHCRNAYLLLHEAMVLTTETKKLQLGQEAVTICERGLAYLNACTAPPKSDLLEIGRCLAEALYVSGLYERSIAQCRKLHEDYCTADPYRPRLVRVLAVWIASLRASSSKNNEEDNSLELGFACGVFVAIHREAAAALSRNADAVANARSYLATAPLLATRRGLDPLLPCPLLPAEHFVQMQAHLALQTIETKVQENQTTS